MINQFLQLPTEIKLQIIFCIHFYSNLKALSLISKKGYKITISKLFYKVDLRTKEDFYGKFEINITNNIDLEDQDSQILPKIYCLLSQPEKLHLIKSFKTGYFRPESIILMNKLLPLLQQDFLIKFSYLSESEDNFPTPLQINFL